MDYCECGGMIVPEKQSDETEFKCRSCGKPYTKEGGELKITETNTDDKKSIDVEAEDEDELPTTDWDCPECGNDTAYWWMMQTRSADEPETRFFKCTECDHTVREYD